jgi:hypothetical protein
VYGTVVYGALAVTNHIGIKNTFVTGTLGASTSGLTGASQYASSYAFFKFSSATSVNYGTLSMSGSSFTNINFW